MARLPLAFSPVLFYKFGFGLSKSKCCNSTGLAIMHAYHNFHAKRNNILPRMNGRVPSRPCGVDGAPTPFQRRRRRRCIAKRITWYDWRWPYIITYSALLLHRCSPPLGVILDCEWTGALFRTDGSTMAPPCLRLPSNNEPPADQSRKLLVSKKKPRQS